MWVGVNTSEVCGSGRSQVATTLWESLWILLEETAGHTRDARKVSKDLCECLTAGSRHGLAVAPKKLEESPMTLELGPGLPLGDRMPLPLMKKEREFALRELADVDINAIADRSRQDAKRNWSNVSCRRTLL